MDSVIVSQFRGVGIFESGGADPQEEGSHTVSISTRVSRQGPGLVGGWQVGGVTVS